MDIDKLRGQAERDQAQAGHDTLAWLLADRLRAMREAGIPESAAIAMARDLNWLVACKGLWPNTPPPATGREDL